ncbi:MAG: OsmC family protein [Fluviicola sp.]|nr:OsmC family protein [Fluviicola sp.]
MTSIKATLREQYTVDNSTRELSWISDEPIEVGGANLGPKPTELLLSALASCKIITVKMYAERKGWSIDDMSVELTFAESDGDKTLIEKRITFEGDLDEKQITRLIDISGRCPVAKMLKDSLEFKIIE